MAEIHAGGTEETAGWNAKTTAAEAGLRHQHNHRQGADCHVAGRRELGPPGLLCPAEELLVQSGARPCLPDLQPVQDRKHHHAPTSYRADV